MRRWLAIELRPIGRDRRSPISASLRSGEWTVRLCAAESLGKLAPNREDAKQALKAVLEDEVYLVREAAAAALKKISEPRA